MLAEMGIVLLLFTVGLEFSLTEIRRIWRKVLIGGTLQVALTALVILALVIAFFGSVSTWRLGLFAGLFVALSSTAIVLQELGTLNQLDSPHGRLVVGVMLFQDLCIVGLLLLVPILSGMTPLSAVPGVLAKAAAAIGVVAIVSKFVLPILFRLVGRERAPRSVSPRRNSSEHRYGMGELAARHFDGARSVPRRSRPRRERVQPPGLRGDTAAARHPRRPVLHLARHARRSGRPPQAVPDRHRHRPAARDREGVGCYRCVHRGRDDDARRGNRGPGSRAGRRVLLHPRAQRARGRTAQRGVLAAPARGQHRHDGGDARGIRGRATPGIVAGD